MKFTPLAGIETPLGGIISWYVKNEIHTPCGDWNFLIAGCAAFVKMKFTPLAGIETVFFFQLLHYVLMKFTPLAGIETRTPVDLICLRNGMKFTPLAGIETIIEKIKQIIWIMKFTPLAGIETSNAAFAAPKPAKMKFTPLAGIETRNFICNRRNRWKWNSHPLRGLKRNVNLCIPAFFLQMKFTPLAGIETFNISYKEDKIINEIHTPCGDWNLYMSFFPRYSIEWNSHPLRGLKLYSLQNWNAKN